VRSTSVYASAQAYLSHTGALLRHVRLIVIPHPEGTMCLPAELAEKSHFVGRIARQANRRAIREHDPASPRIVISGGGGGYPGTFEFYNLAIEAIADLRERYPALVAQLITGPLFRDWRLLPGTVWAASQLRSPGGGPGTDVYINSDPVALKSLRHGTIIHETLHNLTQLGDLDLENFLGIPRADCGNFSHCITTKLVNSGCAGNN
jgi:hypothetical protein